MSILSGWIKTRRRKKTANGYKAVSYDTSAETVFYNNGLTLEESEVSLTQASYDALGNEKLTNDVTYYITDANANDDVINEINKNVAANTTAISELNNALSNNQVGYRISHVFSNTEKLNMQSGDIEIHVINGIATIMINNLKCTPNTHLVYLHGYVNDGFYLYDNDGSGLFIDNSILYSTKAEISHLVFTFVIKHV